MKKWIVMAGVLAIALAVYAAEPVLKVYKSSQATVAITGAYTQIDSLVAVSTDTSIMIISVSGTALLEPLQHLYVGIGNDSANRTSATNLAPNNNLQEFEFTAGSAADVDGYVRVPFYFNYPHLVATQTDITDTFYVNMKVTGYSYRKGKNNVCTVEDFWVIGNLTGN